MVLLKRYSNRVVVEQDLFESVVQYKSFPGHPNPDISCTRAVPFIFGDWCPGGLLAI